MKKICITVCLLLLLCACGEQAPVATTDVSVTTETPATAVSFETTTVTEKDILYLSEVDFSAYRDQLTEEEYAALELYIPVLQGEKTFQWQSGPFGQAMQEVDIFGFHTELWEGVERPAVELMPYAFSLLDIVGDDGLELVLWVCDLGHHKLVLHHAQDSVYGIDYPVRWFDPVGYGVYAGSGGAAAGSYHSLRFENGRFIEERIADWDNDAETYVLQDETVSKDVFAAWEETVATAEIQYIFLTD